MRALRQRFCRFRHSERGASAAEFALVAPVFIFLVLASINLCLIAYSITDLHFAAQRAARCVAMKSSNGGATIAPNTCVDDAATAYTGAPITPTFVRTTAGCGNTITGTGTFLIRTGFLNVSVPLSASACYPLQ